MILIYAIVGLLVVLLLMVIYIYNHLVGLKQNVSESWAAIDTELKRRHDLIPNIVETVKGYASHEKQTLEAVTEARASAVSQTNPAALAGSEDGLTGALRNLFVVAERYPDLKANESFQKLQAELAETETRVSQARRFYNANVRELNTAILSFPASMLAGPFGFKSEQYFEAGQGERDVVAVKI